MSEKLQIIQKMILDSRRYMNVVDMRLLSKDEAAKLLASKSLPAPRSKPQPDDVGRIVKVVFFMRTEDDESPRLVTILYRAFGMTRRGDYRKVRREILRLVGYRFYCTPSKRAVGALSSIELSPQHWKGFGEE